MRHGVLLEMVDAELRRRRVAAVAIRLDCLAHEVGDERLC
jgi:hypothetical protein